MESKKVTNAKSHVENSLPKYDKTRIHNLSREEIAVLVEYYTSIGLIASDVTPKDYWQSRTLEVRFPWFKEYWTK